MYYRYGLVSLILESEYDLELWVRKLHDRLKRIVKIVVETTKGANDGDSGHRGSRRRVEPRRYRYPTIAVLSDLISSNFRD